MAQDAERVVLAARAAFKDGFTVKVQNRLSTLKQFRKFLVDNKERIITCLYEDCRKHRAEAQIEILVGISHLDYLISNLKNFTKPKKVSKRFVDIFDGIYVHSEPLGVVLVMAAWNVPVLTMLPAAGAIAAGNCVIIKPSHNTPSFENFLLNTLPDYINSSCYSVFVGGIPETNKLLDHRFDYIYYTGSATVGKIVHQAASKYLTPVTLELGGKNPVYIDSSVDLKMATRRVLWGKVFGSGEICIAPDYILCEKNVEQEFIEHAKSILEEFYTDALRSCPIVNQHHFQRLLKLMDGLEIAIGGRFDDAENFIEPTIAVNVDPAHPVMQEEIFGPILPIITVNSKEEAVEFINSREKPLTLYVFSEKSSVKNFFLENTSSGSILFNDTIMHLLVESLPFGGVGFSGVGRYKQTYSFDTFVNKKSVLDKNTWKILENVNNLRYPPYSENKTKMSKLLLEHRNMIPLGWTIYVFIFVAGFVLCYICLPFFK